MPEITDIPRELIHVIARFVPFGVPQLARASCSLWSRFFDDPAIWQHAVIRVLRSGRGRWTLRTFAPGILHNIPQLNHILPLPLGVQAMYFTVAKNLVAYGEDRSITVVDTSTLAEVKTIYLTDELFDVKFSPSGAFLACLCDRRYDGVPAALSPKKKAH